jgi:mediator of RNA polymerase II transcription subunit 7
MADGGAERALPAAFPPPPPFWSHFTPENLNKLEQIKKEHLKKQTGSIQKKKWSPTELQSLDVSAELRYLVPPEIPKTGSYNVFGEPQSVRQSFLSIRVQRFPEKTLVVIASLLTSTC